MNLFFDSVILLLLLGSGMLGQALLRDIKQSGTWETRHKKITLAGAALLFLIFVTVFWGSFIEPRRLVTKIVPVDLPNFAPEKPVRVALVSDVHVGTYKKSGWLKRVSKRITDLQPDLVLISGDLIAAKLEHAQYLSTLKAVAARFPTYAVLGDHDYQVKKRPGQWSINEGVASAVRQALGSAGIKVMQDTAEEIELNNSRFWLVGLDDWLAQKTNAQAALAQTNGEGPFVILVHNPDFILDPESKKADLILSGNTHGGQIRLPWLGAVSRLPSKLPRIYDKGLFVELRHSERSEEPRSFQKVRDPSATPQDDAMRRLFITSGISESGPRARLFNPPEIILLELY